jgi:hypothetical protein
MDAAILKQSGVKAKLRPPIRRGQIYQDYSAGERVFLIADGEFDQSLAVTAGEILDILRAGGLVFGSSSMGALRAAEMNSFGMVGVGKIFELIQSASTFHDDWLGHLFDGVSLETITLPFVEIIFLVLQHIKVSPIEWGERLLRAHPFSYDALTEERCIRLVKEMSFSISVQKSISKKIRMLFSGQRASQKKKDALAMLYLAQSHLGAVQKYNHWLAKRVNY